MKKLLMLGSSRGSVDMLEYAKSIGVYTIVTDYLEPDKSHGKQISDEYWMISTSDLDALEKKCREERVTAVTAGCSEFNLDMTMELCRRLNLPCYLTEKSWHYSRNKSAFKELCRQNDVPVPEDYLLSDALTEEELKQVQYPVIVKPVDRSGNAGVSYCHNRDELVDGYRAAREISDNPKIIVERMLVGREFFGYYIFADGEVHQLNIIEELTPKGMPDNIYSITTSVVDCVERIMYEINPKIEKVLKAAGCREGVAQVEFMLDQDDSFYVLELGYRISGDIIERIFPGVMGFNPYHWMVDYALGDRKSIHDLPPIQEHMYERCGCGYTLWVNRSGRISRVEGLEQLRKIPGVTVSLNKYPGDSFEIYTNVGVITFNADTVDALCEKLKQINDAIRVLDDDGQDVIIHYDDFSYLQQTYHRGICLKGDQL